MNNCAAGTDAACIAANVECTNHFNRLDGYNADPFGRLSVGGIYLTVRLGWV